MRPLSRLICVRGSSIPVQQGTDGSALPTASTSGRTSCTFADTLTSSTDLPTNTTDVPALNLEQETEDFVDGLKQGSPNILVTVRVRPVQPRELQNGGKDVVRVLDNKVVLLLDPGLCSHDDVLRVNRTREKRYAFDYVFDASKDQQCVYANTTEFLVDGVLRGFNATAFAYGATGAGKTYTMIGSYEKPGVMVRTLNDLFTKVGQQSVDHEYTIRCSFLEIYNEAVRDLLDTRNEHCEVREDPSRGMAISNICEVDVKTADEILELLQRGNKRRIQEPTDANQTSSRSHAVLQVTVTQKSRTPGMTAELAVGKLSMVDLAGSERASQNNNRGIRMVEGASINRSLLALGNVINALCDKGKTTRNIFVPYRDSKLTRLLKDSLGGSCRTVMIANISPAHTQFEDTNNTLKYANRAKNIKTFSKRNVLSVNCHLEKYTHVIEQLQAEVGTLRAMLASGTQAAVLQEPAATASSSRVAGIVKTLQERQRLRQALGRLDEQLHQLEHCSPINMDGVPTNVSSQAQSLQKAKEDLVTRLRTNAAECEELQHKLLLTPDSTALMHALLKNMEDLLEQNYQLQRTNEQLNETLMQNCRSSGNTSSESVPAQRVRQPTHLSVGTSQQKSNSFLLQDSVHVYSSDVSCCAGRQPQNDRSQQSPNLCSDQNSTSAAQADASTGRRRLSKSTFGSSWIHTSRRSTTAASDTAKQPCSAVETQFEHYSVLKTTPPGSLPATGHSDSSVPRSVVFTRPTNCLDSLESGDRIHVPSYRQRGKSPVELYRSRQSPTTSSMHVSVACSPARLSSGSPRSQDCPFYTPRSQPLALAGGTVPCSRSMSSGVPMAASCISEISVALDSAESDSPRCSTPNLSPRQPTRLRRHSQTPPADLLTHFLKSSIANSASREQAPRALQTNSAGTPEVPTEDSVDMQLKCSVAPLQFQQCFPRLPGTKLAEYDRASSLVSRYDTKETIQLRQDRAAGVSQGDPTLQRAFSRNFSEEAEVPDELGTDKLDKPVDAAPRPLARTVFTNGTACSVSAAQEQRSSPVRRTGRPAGAMSERSGEHSQAGRPSDANDTIRHCPATRHAAAPAKDLPTHEHIGIKTFCRYNSNAHVRGGQIIIDESNRSTHLEAEGLGARARAHFGFRCAGASDEGGA